MNYEQVRRPRFLPPRLSLGRATVTATLFEGLDPSLHADFRKGTAAPIKGAEKTLKHTAGHYGPSQIVSNRRIIDVTQASGTAPVGSSGIQIQYQTVLIIEGIRPERVVRVRPESWPRIQISREEYLCDGASIDERFPTPAIFPEY